MQERTRERWIMREGGTRSGFRYRGPAGDLVRDARTLARVAALRVPPGWRDVHIALDSRAAVQAWGIDYKGRKQYRYHARAVERGDRRKYYRVRSLARELPAIRARLVADFRRDDFAKSQVSAAAVRLLNEGFFRIGSDRYARENKTFGLTTLRKRHVQVVGGNIRFEYRGKRGVRQWKMVADRELARFIARLLEAPGARVFRYRGAHGWADLTARDVNEYVRQVTGRRYSAKDFRTWGGTLRFATVLAELGRADSDTARKRTVALAVRLVAAELGNTPAICRKSYVHPIVVARYLDAGETIAPSLAHARTRRSPAAHSAEERALIRFLDRYFPERRRRRRPEDVAAA